MAYDEANLSSTPLGYATPEQLKSLREYAKVLMTPGQIRPLAHWAPALSDAIGGLMGGYGMHRAGEREKESLDWAGAQQERGLTEATTPPPALTPGVPAASGPRPDISAPRAAAGADPASIRFNNPGAQYPGASARAYGTTGTATIGGGHQIAQFPDPVSGAAAQFDLLNRSYAGLPLAQALTKWSGGNNAAPYIAGVSKATGISPDTVITPQLLNSPQGLALVQAMARHEAGRDYPMTSQQWAEAQSKVFGGAAPPPTVASSSLSFAPTGEVPTGQQPALPGEPVPQLSFADRMSPVTDPPPYREAAARGAAPAAPAARPGAVTPPLPNTSGPPGFAQPIQMPPGMVQPRGTPSPETLRRLLGVAAPYANPAVANTLTNMYLQRNQNIQTEAPFGRVITTPDGRNSWFVPTPQKLEGAKGPGGIQEAEEQVIFDNATKTWRRIGVGNEIGAPAGIPSPPGASTARPNTPPPPASALPRIGPAKPPGATGPRSDVPELQTGPETAGAPQPQAGVQTAGLEEPPADQAMAFAGVPAEEGAQGISNFSPNLLNTMPPVISQGPQATPPAAATPPVQMAQAGGVRPRRTTEDLIEIGRQYEADKEYDKEDIKSYQKQYDLMATAGSTAKNLIPQLELAKMLVDKGVIQGIGADPRLDWNRALELFGSAEAAKKAGITQAFEKLRAGTILTEMKTALQGLGQVRVAEIQLLNDASASRYNTPEANKAILDLQLRAAHMLTDAKAVSEAYKNGVRWDAEGNPIVDANGNAVLHRGRPDRGGMDATISRLMDNHPMRMTPEQHEQYLNIFAQADQRLGKERTGGRGVERPTPQAAPQPQGGGGRPSLDTFNR